MDPTIVCGCGHTGTSIMNRILGAHPDIHSSGKETQFLQKHDFSHFAKTADTFWKACEGAHSKRWIEKTPKHVFDIEAFLSIYHRGKVVVMVRDGRDVALSLARRYKNFQKGLNRWVQDTRASLKYLHDNRVKHVRYEDLVHETEKVLTDVCDFLDVPYDARMLQYHETVELHQNAKLVDDSKVKTLSESKAKEHIAIRSWQINQPLYDGSGRWKQDLKTTEYRIFNSSRPAVDIMKRFGYY